MSEYIGMFGLAQKAGFLVIGEDQLKTAAYDHKIKAMFVSSDAMANARKKAAQIAANGKAPIFDLPFTKAELGKAVGRNEVAVAAISGIEFAYGIAKKLAESNPEKYDDALRSLENKAKAHRASEKSKTHKSFRAKRKENT